MKEADLQAITHCLKIGFYKFEINYDRRFTERLRSAFQPQPS